jgi:hypothetical protein
VLAHPMGSGFQFLLIFIFAARLVLGEQLFTSGLGIIDAPSAGSPAHAGSGLPIAIEVRYGTKSIGTSFIPSTLLGLWKWPALNGLGH